MVESREQKFKKLHKRIMNLKSNFIKGVTSAIKKEAGKGGLHDYLIVWKQLQGIASPIIKDILEKKFPGSKITITTSKSAYPDIKMEWEGFTLAIDIKSNESSKNPWYDIARLDTVIKKRITKFDEEYDLVVKYDSTTKKLIKIFFEPLRETVGLRKECTGVKYRPYDGKLRPKTWDEFENGTVYWKSKEEFLQGITNSQRNRWKILAKEWAGKLCVREKEDFRKIFE
jgi:hypothetical protein